MRQRKGWSASPRTLRRRAFGVSVARFWKTGSVDYNRVPELAGIDVELYRSPGREEVRVSVTKYMHDGAMAKEP